MTNWLEDVGIQSYDDLVASLRNDLQLDPSTDLLPFPRSVWATPTLVNAWTSSGGASGVFELVGYTKDAFGWVHLKGLMSGGTTSTVAFTLPPGYRPAAVVFAAAVQGSLGAGGAVEVAPNGDVKLFINPAGNNVSIDIPPFLAEQ